MKFDSIIFWVIMLLFAIAATGQDKQVQPKITPGTDKHEIVQLLRNDTEELPAMTEFLENELSNHSTICPESKMQEYANIQGQFISQKLQIEVLHADLAGNRLPSLMDVAATSYAFGQGAILAHELDDAAGFCTNQPKLRKQFKALGDRYMAAWLNIFKFETAYIEAYEEIIHKHQPQEQPGIYIPDIGGQRTT